jgi:hypothetical protein
MAHQNILRFYGKKLDIKVDYSSIFDREQEKTESYDLRIDNSETYDFELDYIPDYELVLPNIPVLHKLTFGIDFKTDDYYILAADGGIIMSAGFNKLQYQF